MPDAAILAKDQRRAAPFLSVVLSFYNEESVLAELVSRLRTVMAGLKTDGAILGHELIFVNDASTDGSLDLLLRESDAGRDIVIVNMSNNFGVSECVLAGVAQARGDAIVYMDADLQDPPEVIPEMVRRWQQEPDVEVIYTTRLSRAGEHPFKLWVTRTGYQVVNAISDIRLPVDSGDFKLLSRRVAQELLQLNENKPYIRGLISWIGFKQAQVFYHRAERRDGRLNTKRPAFSRKVINYALDSALISFSDAPLKASLLVGFLVSVIALAYIIVVVFQKIMGWYEPGWPALMAAILLLGGIQLLVLGVLGLYINVIFHNSRGRPRYIIKEVLAHDERASRDGAGGARHRGERAETEANADSGR